MKFYLICFFFFIGFFLNAQCLDIELESTDNCGAVVEWETIILPNLPLDSTIISSHNSGDFFPVGKTEVVYQVYNQLDTVSCSFVIIVNDVIKPELMCIDTIFSYVGENDCSIAVNYQTPTAIDNCQDTIPWHFTLGNGSFESGSPNPFWTESSLTFGTPLCNENACGSGGGSGARTGIWWLWIGGIDFIEQSGVSQVVPIPDSISLLTFWLEMPLLCDSPDDFMEVKIDGQRVYYVDGSSNLCGQIGYQKQIINISDFADGLTHNIEFYGETFGNNGGATSFFIDDVKLEVIYPLISTIGTINNGNNYTVGVYEEYYTAHDTTGNKDTCKVVIQVIDTIAPKITFCPNDMILYLNNSCDTIVNWSNVLATDNCGTESINYSQNSGTIFPIGIHQIIVTVKDSSSNSVKCSFNVEVKDTIKPSFTQVPNNILVYADSNSCNQNVTYQVLFEDNCNVILTTNYNSGDEFIIGQTQVELSLEDASGNQTDTFFIIEIKDTIAPLISGNQDVILYTDAGKCSQNVFSNNIVIQDNCGIETINQSYDLSTDFPVGTTSAFMEAIDSSGNSSLVNFNIIVKDTIAPLIDCVDSIMVSSCNTFVQVLKPTINEDCLPKIISNSINGTDNADGIYEEGETEVIWSITDSSNNISNCTTVIIVKPPLEVNISNLEENYCSNDNSVQLLAQPSGGTFTGMGISNDELDFENLTEGNYYVNYTFTGNDGCLYSIIDSFYLNQAPIRNVSNDTIVNLGESITLMANEGTIYNWSPEEEIVSINDNKITVSPTENQTYFVEIINQDGCSETYEIDVEVVNNPEIIIPNVITPNGDGKNDLWEIKSLISYGNNRVELYNRWGQLLEYYDNYSKEFDGTLDGEKLPDGTYFYVIKVQKPVKGQYIFKGSLDILR